MSIGLKRLTFDSTSSTSFWDRVSQWMSRWRGVIIGVVVAAALIGVVFYFSPSKIWQGIKSGFNEADRQLLPAGLVQERPTLGEIPLEEGVLSEGLDLTLLPGVKTYEETAQAGEGVTHLARKALDNYLKEKGVSFNLTPEHKVYIEDYIKDKTGEKWLTVGETLSFSESLIAEAIQAAENLTPEQLKNLEQYSALIPNL